MFKPVSPKLRVSMLEEDILRHWKVHHIFEKSGALRLGDPEFVFYEGPPTANGKPGVHHALARAFKDIFPRYKVMRGYHVIRRGGWDTHGLPVEIGVEKKLGFNNKNQIEAYGIAAFNELCRKSAFEYIQDWEKFTDRLGFWVDLGDAYVTFTNDYIESVWWILKNFWDKGLLYQGYKVVPYCPRCGTPLSDHEVALGYREAEDPSIYVRLPLVDDPEYAMSGRAPQLHPNVLFNIADYKRIRQGDPLEVWDDCNVIIEGVYHTPFQEHAYLQPEAGSAYMDDDGVITVYCAGQWTWEDQQQIAAHHRQ